MIINANKDDMNKEIINFGDSIRKGDDVLFYFSGHGLSIGTDHCLLPNDYDGSGAKEKFKSTNSITFYFIREYIQRKRPSHMLFLFDCCKVKTFLKSDGERNFSEINCKELGENIIIASSTGDSTSSSYNRHDLSCWTSYLIEELKKHVEKVNLVDLLKKVRNNMNAENLNQIPWENDSCSETEKFLI